MEEVVVHINQQLFYWHGQLLQTVLYAGVGEVADTSKVVHAGLDFSDTGKNGVILPNHDAGVVTPIPDHVPPGDVSCAEEREKNKYQSQINRKECFFFFFLFFSRKTE